MRKQPVSIRRIARVIEEAVSSVGRWCGPPKPKHPLAVRHPVRTDKRVRALVRTVCEQERHRTYGHRRVRALLLRHHGVRLSRKTVYRVMKDLGLLQRRAHYKPGRPKRVERMSAAAPNRAWQVDMTSFQLSDLTPLYLEVVIDCCTRKIVGRSLDRRCRAREWIAAVRCALEGQGLDTRESRRGLVIRTDNGAQPSSNSAPDDNAYGERVIRTIKEEEIWSNSYDTWTEAHAAIDAYIQYYNNERIHSSLDYRTPVEAEASIITLKAA